MGCGSLPRLYLKFVSWGPRGWGAVTSSKRRVPTENRPERLTVAKLGDEERPNSDRPTTQGEQKANEGVGAAWKKVGLSAHLGEPRHSARTGVSFAIFFPFCSETVLHSLYPLINGARIMGILPG